MFTAEGKWWAGGKVQLGLSVCISFFLFFLQAP